MCSLRYKFTDQLCAKPCVMLLERWEKGLAAALIRQGHDRSDLLSVVTRTRLATKGLSSWCAGGMQFGPNSFMHVWLCSFSQLRVVCKGNRQDCFDTCSSGTCHPSVWSPFVFCQRWTTHLLKIITLHIFLKSFSSVVFFSCSCLEMQSVHFLHVARRVSLSPLHTTSLHTIYSTHTKH